MESEQGAFATSIGCNGLAFDDVELGNWGPLPARLQRPPSDGMRHERLSIPSKPYILKSEHRR
jgi:hypothetical protein